MNPTFSIILPSYNHEKYIREALDSIMNQTYKDFELIIIDDCSIDHSRGIIEEYENKDRRVRAFFHEENKGIAYTVNEGLSLAKGKYIVFSSSDDVYENCKLEIVNKAFEENPTIDFVYSDAYVLAESKEITQKLFSEFGAKPPKEEPLERLKVFNFIIAPTVVIKSEKRHGIRLDERLKYSNDWLFWIELLQHMNLFYIDRPLLKYRMHDSNTLSDAFGCAMDNIKMEGILLEKVGLSKEHRKHWRKVKIEKILWLLGYHKEKQDFSQVVKTFYLLLSAKPPPFTIKNLIIPKFWKKIKAQFK